MLEQYEMYEMLFIMWIYDLIMFVRLCRMLPICMAPLMLYCILGESNLLVANKLTSYLILIVGRFKPVFKPCGLQR